MLRLPEIGREVSLNGSARMTRSADSEKSTLTPSIYS